MHLAVIAAGFIKGRSNESLMWSRKTVRAWSNRRKFNSWWREHCTLLAYLNSKCTTDRSSSSWLLFFKNKGKLGDPRIHELYNACARKCLFRVLQVYSSLPSWGALRYVIKITELLLVDRYFTDRLWPPNSNTERKLFILLSSSRAITPTNPTWEEAVCSVTLAHSTTPLAKVEATEPAIKRWFMLHFNSYLSRSLG